MPCLTWSDAYCLKIEAIDDQHKGLFDLVNRLFDSMQGGASNQTIRQVLAKLICYTMTHFAAEEAAMEAYSYPGLTEHRRQHQQLTAQVLEFVGRYHFDRGAIGTSLVDFLQSWLTSHILGSDHDFAQFLIGRGSA
jgi:hemerythrin-like metal-binding protein